MAEQTFGIPAYYLRFGTAYYKTFCTAADAERYLEWGEELAYDSMFSRHSSLGLEPEPGKTYTLEGHDGCIEDECGCMCHCAGHAGESDHA
jgi:hypothetical protein